VLGAGGPVRTGAIEGDLGASDERFFYTSGGELWTLDGTAPRSLGAAPNDLRTSGMAGAGDVLWAVFNTAPGTDELRRYDGTGLLSTAVLSGTTSSGPTNLVLSPPHLFLDVALTNEGREYYRSDGTDAGTFLILGLAGSNGTVAGTSTAGLIAPDGSGGAFLRAANLPAALYRSDGTVGGTVPMDLGTLVPALAPLAARGGYLYLRSDYYASRIGPGDVLQTIHTSNGLRIDSSGMHVALGRIWFTGQAEGDATSRIWFVE
jgi:hypothetical protein